MQQMKTQSDLTNLALNNLFNLVSSKNVLPIFDLIGLNYSVIDTEGNYLTQNNIAFSEVSQGLMNAEEIDPATWADCKKVMINNKREIKEEFFKGRYYVSIKQPLLEDGISKGILVVSYDITEKKQAEIAKREFILNMQHDLRTPFSGVYGIANILYDNATDPKQKEYLGYILTSSEQWMAIVDQILSVTSVEKDVIELTPFDIYDVVDEVCKFLIAKIKLKNLELIIDCPSKIIHCDRLRIHRILLNLVSNAVKFTETGKITLTVAVDEQLKIIVDDTGCGIPEDKLEFIFEKFAKLSLSNKYADKFQGAGLGLYVSKYYVNELKGTITVESTLDRGSRFIVSIPEM